MQDNPYILGFTAGELSPWLSTRFDLPQHRKGAARIENFLVEPYGGVSRRCGTRFQFMCADSEGHSRLFPFTYSEDDYLMLEIYPGKIRFWKETDWLRDASSNIYELSTPWTTPEILNSLRFIQVNDVIFVTGSTIYPSQIRRIDDVDWVYERCEFNPLPKGPNITVDEDIQVYLIDEAENEYVVDFPDDYPLRIYHIEIPEPDYLIINASTDTAEYFLNETFTINATVITGLGFDTYSIGTVLAIKQTGTTHYLFYTVIRPWTVTYLRRGNHPREYPFCFSPGVSWFSTLGKPFYVPGGWSLKTTGTWNSNWEIRRAYPTAAEASSVSYLHWDWHRVQQFSQSSYSERENWAFSDYEKEPSSMMVTCLSSDSFTVKSPFYFRIEQMTHDVRMRVVGSYGYSERKLKVQQVDTSVKIPANFSPKKICFSAFGLINGYPSFCGMHEGRLWFGGTVTQPVTLRASALDDFYNFRLDSDADSALELTLASSKQSRMCWMSTERGLLLGTTEAEWLLTSSDSGGISATSASFRKESTVGSENKEAHGVENSVFYVQRGGKRLREISYKLEADGYTSTDTSLLSEHLFSSGIKEWVVQRGSSTRVWVLMEDHTVAVLTTNAAQQVTAWQRVSFDGAEVLHISCIVSKENHDDDVWFIMRRASNKITVECLQDNGIYLDGYKEFVPGFKGFIAEHLCNQHIVYYPTTQPQDMLEGVTNADGMLEDTAYRITTYAVGVRVKSQIETFPVEQGNNFNTVSQQARVKLRLLDSDPSFQYKSTHVDHWEIYDPVRDHLSYPYTGAVRVTQIPDPGVGQGFALMVDSLKPFNLLSLSIENDFHGR